MLKRRWGTATNLEIRCKNGGGALPPTWKEAAHLILLGAGFLGAAFSNSLIASSKAMASVAKPLIVRFSIIDKFVVNQL